MTKGLISVLGIMLLMIVSFNASSADELEDSIQAHGGLDTFRSYGTLQYDLTMNLGDRLSLSDTQLFDLNSRNALITSEDYKIGFDGNEAWITPGMEAMPIPPRFYSLTPFYFFGLPFLFADPGVNAEQLGVKELDGKEYNVVKFSFDQGVGDSPDDDYVAYFDKDTNQLVLVHYIVTYPPLMEGKSIEELERHAVLYEEWQEVGGLTVPKKVTFYGWNDDKPDDSFGGGMVFENVTFKEAPPDASSFTKPEGAAVDNSHIAQ